HLGAIVGQYRTRMNESGTVPRRPGATFGNDDALSLDPALLSCCLAVRRNSDEESSRSVRRVLPGASHQRSSERSPPARRRAPRQEDPMAIESRKSVNIVAALAVLFAASAALSDPAQAQSPLGSISDNDSIVIDGKTFEIRGAKATGDVAAQIKNRG